MSTVIRRATLADAEALVAASVLAFEYDAVLYPQIPVGGPPGYDSLDQMQQNINRNHCYAILVDDQIVGGMFVYVPDPTACHVERIFIAPDFHNRGLGTYAMQYLEDTYPTATRWMLDTPVWAIRNRHFYEKLGYVVVGEEAHEDITLVLYEKHL